jgi:hypothetical protein
MSLVMRRVLLGVSAATLVAVIVTVVAALGLAPALPWLVSFVATAAMLAALSRVVFGVGGRVNRIIGVLGLAVALGYVIVMVAAFLGVDPVLAGGLIAIPYLVMQGLLPPYAAACGIWGLYLALHRVRED